MVGVLQAAPVVQTVTQMQGLGMTDSRACIAWHSMAQHQHNMAEHGMTQRSTAQHSIAQHSLPFSVQPLPLLCAICSYSPCTAFTMQNGPSMLQ